MGDGRVHPSSKRTNTTTNTTHNAKLTLKDDVTIFITNNQMQVKRRRGRYNQIMPILFQLQGTEIILINVNTDLMLTVVVDAS